MASHISSAEVKGKFDDTGIFALIDVREQSEHQEEQIIRSTQISIGDLAKITEHLIQNRDTEIILYSGAEDRATKGAEVLEKAGYTNVKILQGGLLGWKASGGDTYAGIHVYSKLFGEVLYERRKDLIHEITGEELYDRIAAGEDILVIDVRPEEEVATTGTIPGAINIPGVELPLRITDYVRPGRTIVLTCAGRTRGYVAVAGINLLGLADALDLENGTKGWHFAGHELAPLGKKFTELPGATDTAKAKAALQQLAQSEKITFLTAEELKSQIDNTSRTVVLDVRQESEYAKEHILGSRSFPGGQAIQNSDEAALLHNAEYVFVDEDESRAILTAYWYGQMKIQAKVLKGGISAWKAQGGALAFGKEFQEQWHSGFVGTTLEEEHQYIDWEKNLINKGGDLL